MRNSLPLLSFYCLATFSGAQTLPPGSVDHGFDPGDGFEVAQQLFQTMRVLVQPDGKVLVGGDFLSYHDLEKGSFVRLGPDGVQDAAFNASNALTGIVRDIALDPENGRILLAGITNLAPGTPGGGMAVLLADGTVDPGFSTGGGFTGGNQIVTAVAVQDGKYLVGGRFFQYQGITRRFLTRLNADGSVDPTFPQPFNAYMEGNIHKILVLPNEDFVVIGALGFDSFETHARIWYFNADGGLNATLTNAMGQINGVLQDIHRLENGQLLILGTMTSYAGQSVAGRLIRIGPDGTLDNTFSSGLVGLTQGGFQGTLTRRMAVQADGRVVVVGYFTNVAGTAYKSIVRLNSDGTIDPEWDPGTGFDHPTTDVAVTDDERIYVVGEFWQYDGTPRSGIVRIHGEATNATGMAAAGMSDVRSWPNPAQDLLHFDAPAGIDRLQVIDPAGRVLMEQMSTPVLPLTIDVRRLAPGSYLLRTWHATESRVDRFVIAR